MKLYSQHHKGISGFHRMLCSAKALGMVCCCCR